MLRDRFTRDGGATRRRERELPYVAQYITKYKYYSSAPLCKHQITCGPVSRMRAIVFWMSNLAMARWWSIHVLCRALTPEAVLPTGLLLFCRILLADSECYLSEQTCHAILKCGPWSLKIYNLWFGARVIASTGYRAFPRIYEVPNQMKAPRRAVFWNGWKTWLAHSTQNIAMPCWENDSYVL